MKMMKRSIISLILALVMIAMPIGDTYTLTPVYADTTVYVTPTGSKYHTHKCGRGNYYASTLSAALARGLTACKKCFGSSGGYSYSSGSRSAGSSASEKKAIKVAPFQLKTSSIFLLKGKSKTLGTKNASGTIRWTSSKNSVATVLSGGKVTAKGAGKAMITATCNGKSVKCKVTVEDPKLSATSLKIKFDGEKTLKLKGCKHSVKWYTTDEDVCDIYGNTVYANGAGTARIKAKVHGKTYSCKVVVAKPQVSGFSLSEMQMQLAFEEGNTGTIYIEDVDDILWDYYDLSAVSSDPGVVEIYGIEDDEVSFEVIGVGEADITVSFGGKKCVCHVSVVDENAVTTQDE